MDANEQWQFDASAAALTADGRTLLRSLLAGMEKIDGLRTRFEARSPAPRGELVLCHGETEIARVLLKPLGVLRVEFADEPARDLPGLPQTRAASERIARRAQELADAAPQLGLFAPRK